MRSHLNHRLIFASGLFLLFVCAAATAWTLYRFHSGETWVRHTYDVELLVGRIENDVDETGRARRVFLDDHDKRYLQHIEDLHSSLLQEVSQLRSMVHDNLDEAKSAERLEQAVRARFIIIDESVLFAKGGNTNSERQDLLTDQLAKSSLETIALGQTMQSVESSLLDRRIGIMRSLFAWIIAILAISFLLSMYLLWEHYRGLMQELVERRRAEQNALNLSAQLLNAQDQERRKFARELHDDLGQNLVAAKMMSDSLLNRPPERQKIVELSALLDEAVKSTRSLSHLLHPPLVEELGFVAAARSYLEGFAQRTGVKLAFDLPDLTERLPRDIELTFFRVLQESLTNVQRHSKSSSAEVKFALNGKTATLEVRDHGVGLPPRVLQNFRENGTDVGVGLAGMKERVRERRGRFDVRSDSSGTLVSATLPVSPDSSAA
ncbi:MAG TPA: histidine kinase [Verrucomicrobiae bacterium]|nr:histidine kinase [Verrucomicrobiae bacterium]